MTLIIAIKKNKNEDILCLYHHKPKENCTIHRVTNNLQQRMNQHYENRGKSETFAGKYYCYNLIYYEEYTEIKQAIEREKEIKLLRRELKEDLIKGTNPSWEFIKVN